MNIIETLRQLDKQRESVQQQLNFACACLQEPHRDTLLPLLERVSMEKARYALHFALTPEMHAELALLKRVFPLDTQDYYLDPHRRELLSREEALNLQHPTPGPRVKGIIAATSPVTGYEQLTWFSGQYAIHVVGTSLLPAALDDFVAVNVGQGVAVLQKQLPAQQETFLPAPAHTAEAMEAALQEGAMALQAIIDTYAGQCRGVPDSQWLTYLVQNTTKRQFKVSPASIQHNSSAHAYIISLRSEEGKYWHNLSAAKCPYRSPAQEDIHWLDLIFG